MRKDARVFMAHLCQACSCYLQRHRDLILVIRVQVRHEPAAVVCLCQVRAAQHHHRLDIMGMSLDSLQGTAVPGVWQQSTYKGHSIAVLRAVKVLLLDGIHKPAEIVYTCVHCRGPG